ncbi:hypothetical protein A2U01_0067285 [Trifolium medium]|uniref:Uncharacterized protein n=1 Tax=Trifolium medium TaxID=97028 RepID=A0A392SDT3_9FABA|nr:hypothetical protein [Trifolium medium]
MWIILDSTVLQWKKDPLPWLPGNVWPTSLRTIFEGVDNIVVPSLLVPHGPLSHDSSPNIHPGLIGVGPHLLGVCLLAFILHLSGLVPPVLRGNQAS